MITTNYNRQSRLPNNHDIDMISPSDNNTEELQITGNVSSVTVSSGSTSSGANTGKQKMKASSMQTCGGGAPIGRGAYITQRKLKFRGGSIQSKKFTVKNAQQQYQHFRLLPQIHHSLARQTIPVMIARLHLLNIPAVVKRVVKNLQFHLKFLAINLLKT